MSDEPDSNEMPPQSQGGVFGNLPDARPGTRSPRRHADASKPAVKKAKPTPKKRTTAKKPTAKPKAKPAAPPPRAEPEAPADDRTGGLSDVAWAGIAVAAEAATIGVRLASRAIEAVRGNPERESSESD